MEADKSFLESLTSSPIRVSSRNNPFNTSWKSPNHTTRLLETCESKERGQWHTEAISQTIVAVTAGIVLSALILLVLWYDTMLLKPHLSTFLWAVLVAEAIRPVKDAMVRFMEHNLRTDGSQSFLWTTMCSAFQTPRRVVRSVFRRRTTVRPQTGPPSPPNPYRTARSYRTIHNGQNATDHTAVALNFRIVGIACCLALMKNTIEAFDISHWIFALQLIISVVFVFWIPYLLRVLFSTVLSLTKRLLRHFSARGESPGDAAPGDSSPSDGNVVSILQQWYNFAWMQIHRLGNTWVYDRRHGLSALLVMMLAALICTVCIGLFSYKVQSEGQQLVTYTYSHFQDLVLGDREQTFQSAGVLEYLGSVSTNLRKYFRKNPAHQLAEFGKRPTVENLVMYLGLQLGRTLSKPPTCKPDFVHEHWAYHVYNACSIHEQECTRSDSKISTITDMVKSTKHTFREAVATIRREGFHAITKLVYGLWKKLNSIDASSTVWERWEQMRRLLTENVMVSLTRVMEYSTWLAVSAFRIMLTSFLFLSAVFYLLRREQNVVESLLRSEHVHNHSLFQHTDENGNPLADLEKAIITTVRGVLGSTGKLVLYHALLTWSTFSLLGLDIVYISTFLSSVMALFPVVPSFLVAFVGGVQLFHQAQPGYIWQSGILIMVHMHAYFYVDTAMYGTVPYSHPFVVGVCVALGMEAFGLQGIILGPLLVCVPVIMYDYWYRRYNSSNRRAT